MANGNFNTPTHPAILRLTREHEAELRNKMVSVCQLDEDGRLIRGYVDAVACPGCKMPRWNDGTRCRNPLCGMYVGAALNAEEMYREA